MTLSVHFLRRDFTELGMPAGLTCTVELLSWSAAGGPDRCRLRFAGEAGALWELAELLRCAVEVRDERQEPVWWGYVDAASIQAGRLKASVSLSEMANSVRVVYSTLLPGLGLVGTRVTSAAAEDTDSIAAYGRKELQHPAGGLNSRQAEALREKLLQEKRWPVATVTVEQEAGEAGELECLGWWHVLDWQYYSQAAGREEQLAGGVQHWLGAQLADSQLGQSFSLGSPGSWTAESLTVRVKTIGAPADNLVFELCQDAAGVPGTVLASATLAGPTIGASTNLRVFELQLSPAVMVYSGYSYWIRARRSGAIDGMNYYELDLSESAGYSRGALYVWNGASWAARAPAGDLFFRLLGNQETTVQIAGMLGQAPLLAGVEVRQASAVFSCQYRLGGNRLRTEVEQLLAAGTYQVGGGRRLLAKVDVKRIVTIEPAPGAGAGDWFLMRSGVLVDANGREVAPWCGVAGRWLRLADLVPGGADVTKLGNLAWVWVEGSEWTRKDGLKIRPLESEGFTL